VAAPAFVGGGLWPNHAATQHDLPALLVFPHRGARVAIRNFDFGRTVNIASRIAEFARPGEVLVTREVVEESEGSGCRFTPIGPVELKGVSGTVELHSVHRAS
jgi:adenylate cyclase